MECRKCKLEIKVDAQSLNTFFISCNCKSTRVLKGDSLGNVNSEEYAVKKHVNNLHSDQVLF